MKETEMAGNELQGFISMLIIFIVIGFVRMLYQYATVKTQRITIAKLKFGADNSRSQYMIYTKDGQVIRNSNLVFFGKFKSEVGKTYNVTTCGLRVPLLGWYKNLISITEIKTNKHKSTKKSN